MARLAPLHLAARGQRLQKRLVVQEIHRRGHEFALDEDFRRAIGRPQHLERLGHATHAVEVLGRGVLDVFLALRQQQQYLSLASASSSAASERGRVT
jgi:hypothetical protein